MTPSTNPASAAFHAHLRTRLRPRARTRYCARPLPLRSQSQRHVRSVGCVWLRLRVRSVPRPQCLQIQAASPGWLRTLSPSAAFGRMGADVALVVSAVDAVSLGVLAHRQLSQPSVQVPTSSVQAASAMSQSQSRFASM